jgi:hypothetical protein
MSTFHEGQAVEVWCFPDGEWEKAKIVRLPHAPHALDDGRKYTVQFPDGTRAIFNAEYIRDRFPLDNHQMRLTSNHEAPS